MCLEARRAWVAESPSFEGDLEEEEWEGSKEGEEVREFSSLLVGRLPEELALEELGNAPFMDQLAGAPRVERFGSVGESLKVMEKGRPFGSRRLAGRGPVAEIEMEARDLVWPWPPMEPLDFEDLRPWLQEDPPDEGESPLLLRMAVFERDRRWLLAESGVVASEWADELR